jgi:cobalt-precorrin 5A hydrolase
MRIAVLAITKEGASLGEKVNTLLSTHPSLESNLYLFEKVPSWMQENFSKYDGIICIMATGIVVRSIAPWLVHKSQDPAVVVMDEKGQFVISLLSGHLGGANDLAKTLAEGLGAQAVITTATDVQGTLAIDNLAKKYNLGIENYQLIKHLNTLLLNRVEVEIFTQYPLEIANLVQDKGNLQNIKIHPIEDLPQALTKEDLDLVEQGKKGWVIITNQDLALLRQLPKMVMVMRPRNIIVGIGCRRGTPRQVIETAVLNGLAQLKVTKESIINLASVDIKRDEEGLLELAESWQVPIKFFSTEEIAEVIENNLIDNLRVSEFVREKIGVGGVCEPVTVLSNKTVELVLPKTIYQGVTIAIGVVPSML